MPLRRWGQVFRPDPCSARWRMRIRARPEYLTPPFEPSAQVVTLGGQDLPGHVVAVLLRVEDAPAGVERRRELRPEHAADARVAVRYVDAGDLVVALVLEALRAAQRGVDRRRHVAALRDRAHRLDRGQR